MNKTKRITLKDIKNALNIKSPDIKTDTQFLEYILSLCPQNPVPSDNGSVSIIMNGNIRGNSYKSTDFFNLLLVCLKKDDAFSTLQSKIEMLIDKSPSRIDSKHSIFHSYSIAPEGHENEPHYIQLRYAIDMLLSVDNRQGVCYALSLLVLCAVFWKDMEKLSFLYEPKVIQKIIASSSSEIWSITEGQSFFTDSRYMGTYHIYFYRGVSSGNAEIRKNTTLTFTLGENNLPTATLTFNPSHPNFTFEGKPLYSENDNMVYIFMRNKNSKVGILCFEYTPFYKYPMYLRTGIFLTTSPKRLLPHAQKVIITSKKLSDDELKLADGFLHIHKGRLYLTNADLEAFQQNFKCADWWSKYESEILPFIKGRERSVYIINDDQILSDNSDFSLDVVNQLRILLALHSVERISQHGKDQFFDAEEYDSMPHLTELCDIPSSTK